MDACEERGSDPVTPSFNPFLCISLFSIRYDVWLLNWRGNRYSNRHRKLSPDDPEYWNFTLDDFVEYDLPAFINFILQKTGKRESPLMPNTRTCYRQKKTPRHLLTTSGATASRIETGSQTACERVANFAAQLLLNSISGVTNCFGLSAARFRE